MATANQRIQNIRTTLDTLQTKANNNELLAGEIYVLTGAGSENKIAKAIATNSFEIIGGATGDNVNYETISANKTLLPTDVDYQIYTLNGTYNLYLPTTGVATNKKFVISVTNNTTYYLNVYDGATLIDYVCTNDLKIYRYNGTTWYIEEIGNGIKSKVSTIYTTATGYNATAIGSSATATGYNATATGYNATATGYNATASNTFATATGYNATAIGSSATAIGSSATATGYNATATGRSATATGNSAIASGSDSIASGSDSIATGYYANTNIKDYSFSIGSYTKAERNREIVSTASTSTTNKAQLIDQKYTESTFTNSTDAWREMYIDGSSARLVLLNDSIYNFILQINCIRIATSVDPVGKGKAWKIEGAIARSSLGGTRFLGTPTKTLLGQDPDGDLDLIDVQVIANTTNNTLEIQIKTGLGAGNNTYRFSANIRATETRS